MVKCIAVILIINSHADICYPKYGMLATGGAIGDCLFLFCSGYTLFCSKVRRFDNYYKRRINRIYPSVFACLAVEMILGFDHLQNLTLMKLLGGGGQFVVAIMVYYILLYLIQRFLIDRILWTLIVVSAVTLVAYWFFPYKYETGSSGIYGITTLFRWIPYFGMMLMGAWIGMKRKNGDLQIKARWTDAALMLCCTVVFYGIQFAAKKMPVVGPWQIVTLPFLAGIVYYFWKCCNADFFKGIYETRTGNWVVMAVGGLCLESYLIQFCLFTDKLNWLFPLNIPLIMLTILVVAYVCRCLARLFSQTFRTEDYAWKEVFRLP